MSSPPGAQEKTEKGQDQPQFKFGFIPANTDDKASAKEGPKAPPAPASDFKFSFGYVPDQEPPRKSIRSHGHIDKQAADPLSKPVAKSEEIKEDDTSKNVAGSATEATREKTTTFAFSFTGAMAACKPPGDNTKTVFSFPNMGPHKTDDTNQSAPPTEHSTSLVSTKNHTTVQSIDKENYQNKNSLFEGGDVELYCYDKDEGKWIAQNKGYLQIIGVKESPEERQVVFSRVGTSVVAINSRLSKDISIASDKKRYIKVPLHNDLTKTALIALFKFATEELRDACLAAMPQQDSSEEELKECAK